MIEDSKHLMAASPTPGSKDNEPQSPEPCDEANPGSPRYGLSFFSQARDDLIFVFVMAMFLRVFVIEMYKIPSGSMSPTLLGDAVAHVDWNEDGTKDIVINGQDKNRVFLNMGDHFELDQNARVTRRDIERLKSDGLLQIQNDRIIVNKFAYWSRPPERGDIVVFKIPDSIWLADTPFYIKRVVGTPNEKLSFDGALIADGERIIDPPFFEHWQYSNRISKNALNYSSQPDAKYQSFGHSNLRVIEMVVPENEIYVFGDNTDSSADSRFWGGVPLERVKGKAFFRFAPFDQIKFLR